MIRIDGRLADQLREVKLTPGFVSFAEGSVLFELGKTRVLCNASLEEGVPRWMHQQGVPGGWITAEYAMLPRSTQQRTTRESGTSGGRSQEIRRLIGRSLRAAVNLELLGPRTLTADCDVIQADGGTRCAAITGSYVALAIALRKLIKEGIVPQSVLKSPVAAVSTGLVGGKALLDLCYQEDKHAQVDVNVVMNAAGQFIEVQGAAEAEPFEGGELERLLDLAHKGIGKLLDLQQETLARL